MNSSEYGQPEVFFLPDEIGRESTCIPAALFNRCRLVLSHCMHEHLFVPIRSMQYLAVIDKDEIIFVDSLSYAYGMAKVDA